MEWDDFCVHSKTPEGVDECQEVEKTLRSPEARPFVVHGVDEKSVVGYEVVRYFEILNETEFITEMGGKPYAKMPSCPSMLLRKAGADPDDKESVNLFKSTLFSHRMLRIFYKHEFEDEVVRLAPFA